DNRLRMEPSKEYLFEYKGFYFVTNTSPEYVASLEDFEIRDSDIFLVTYPKSGTVWTQNILSLILHEGHRNGTENMETMERIPWLEYNIKNLDYANLPLPRVFASHLPYYLVPRDLRNKRGRVVYVSRNPKDVLVSYYHFSKYMKTVEDIPDFNLVMDRFLAGKVVASSWLDHVSGWYSHAEDFNILFLTYEEMKKVRSSV
ncbi:ST3A1 sulfotransferase, partial [Rostratula benghalensis]|nr:ST3A1 sulfotransferase [Rostratula benghalensis]